jgi:photosystem II stability/assembly factor-like uncharacterized protein
MILRFEGLKSTLGFAVLCLAGQLNCGVNSVPRHSAAKTTATPFILPVESKPLRADGDSINLADRSSFRNVELADTGLMVLTEFSTAGSFKMFAPDGDGWSVVAADRFVGSGPAQGAVRCVDFLDKRRGWIVDWEQAVWASTDAGVNWSRIGKLPDQHVDCDSLQFTTPTTGWYSDVDGLYKTDDSGKTWTRVRAVRGSITVKFASPQLGWAVSVDDEDNSTIYSTADAGASWASHHFKGERIRDFYPVTSEYGIASVRRLLFQTSDGGARMHVQPGLPPEFAVESLFCSDPRVWWVAGYVAGSRSSNPRDGSARVYRTVDGGNTWSAIPVTTSEPFFSRIKFFDSNFGVLVGQNSLHQTTDGGQSWTEILRTPPSGN